ncbi:hypothetical protein [Streptomyces sp. TLI_185]|uniref:hypothetical protein n=1 Tax=Streptomyces sp. TLI_185 TaxID=2485151 RepID=UPI000F4FF307|nr:hypothetical protein [Streptomyces sp. TLI_185]
MLQNVATSGFDLHAWWDGPVPELLLRRCPSRQTLAAELVLRERARLLTRAVLLQYPALWAASARGRAPLHAAALTVGGEDAALLVGPSGSGKTTLVGAETAAGGTAVGDNLAVGDGHRVWGVVEPVRSELGGGRRAPHGRREMALSGRVASLDPTLLVVIGRGTEHRVTECSPDAAALALTASTYAAGELRRYWGIHALLCLGTGVGPPHPLVSETATAFAGRLRCVRVELPAVLGERLTDHLAAKGAEAWTRQA